MTQSAQEAVSALSTLGGYIKNKSTVIALLGAAFYGYHKYPESLPFAELLYTVLTALAVMTLAPLLRVLVFHEAAAYAESGGLDNDIKGRAFTPALVHYWFATAICYASAIACFATITK